MIIDVTKEKVIQLGRLGENEARIIRFPLEDVKKEYPNATFTLLNKRPGDPAGYPVIGVQIDGDYLLWTVQSADVAHRGNGECELIACQDNVIVKSYIYTTFTDNALDGSGNPPEPWESWVQQVKEEADRAEAAAELLEHPGAEATTLNPGDPASASYSEGTFSFGIPKGDKGETGESGVYYGEETPTDPKVNVWIDPNGSGESVPTIEETDAENVDLDLTDEDGNVLVRFQNGGIKTLYFDSDSMSDASARQTDAEGVDLDFVDSTGNVILRLQNGYLKTKKTDTTDPFEVPSYYPEYLDEKCERIKYLMEHSNGGDAFIFITDQHMDNDCAKNTHHSFKLIHYIAQKCRINKLFCGGDLMNSGNFQYADEFRRSMGGRTYQLCGNHEYLGGASDSTLAYMLTSSFDDEIGNSDRRYFYIDNPKAKIRYICLNAYAEADSPSSPANNGYEQTQLDWLTGEAMVVESGWMLIIFTHSFYAVPDMRYPEMTINNTKKAVLDLIGTTATANNTDVIIIQGHTHVDGIKTSDAGIPIMITTCDKWGAATGEDLEPWLSNRIPGTITEQAFDVCVVDKKNKKFTAVRVGAYDTGDSEQDASLTEAGERVINY